MRRRRGTRSALRRCPLGGWAGFSLLAGERLAACSAGQGVTLRRRRGTRRALRWLLLGANAGFSLLAGERLAACGAGQGVALRRRRGTRSALRRCPLGGWAGFSLLAGERLAACSAGQGVTLRRRRGTRRALRRCPLGGWAGFASLAGERLAACSAGQGVTLRRRRGTRRALRWLLLGANAGFASLARERRAAHTWQGMALRLRRSGQACGGLLRRREPRRAALGGRSLIRRRACRQALSRQCSASPLALDQGGLLCDRRRHEHLCRDGSSRCAGNDSGCHRGAVDAWGCRSRLLINDIDDVVSDRCVVNICEHDIVRRRRDVARRVDVSGDRDEDRNRQDIRLGHHQRRGKHELRRRRGQKDDRRRRRKRVNRIGENHHWPLDIDDFRRRRRRNVVSNGGEGRRRLERHGERLKPIARLGRVRALGIAPQIRPIRVRSIHAAGPVPGERLTPRRQKDADAARKGIRRIGCKEFLIAMHRVAFERGGISLLGAEIAKRRRAHRLHPLRIERGRRRVGCTLKKDEGGLDARRTPGHLGAFCRFAHAHAHAIEDFGGGKAALANHFREGLRIGAIRPALLRRGGARRRVEGDEHVRLGLGKSESARERLARLRERVGSRSIEDDEARLKRQACKPLHIIRDSQRLGGHIRRRRNPCIDRYEVILALELQAVAGKINEGNCVWPRGLGLIDKIPECRAQRFAVEIARPAHVKSCGLQRLSNEARVVGGRAERGCLIGSVADHKRNPLFLLCPQRRRKCEKADCDAEEEQPRDGSHDPGTR